MSEAKSENIPFQIAYVSSQTDQNPANNIINASPYSDGWISFPNSGTPQTVVLDFLSPTTVTLIKFVSHQSKIASEITISTGKDASSWRKSQFQEIDKFSFSENQQNNFKAREVKVAHLSTLRFRYLKLVITGIYQNKLNKHNQVGIVSITAQGFSDSSLSNVDPEVAELERRKKEAIQNEDFDLAKRIKSQIDNLKDNKAALAELNQRKDEAIRNEDFDLAKQIKAQIQSLMNPAIRIQSPTQQEMEPPPRRSPPPVSTPQSSVKSEDRSPPEQIIATDQADKNPDNRQIKPMRGDMYALVKDEESPRRSEPSPPIDYDKRPIRDPRMSQKEDLMEFDEEASKPDSLDKRQAQEADVLIQAFGKEEVTMFFSKNASNKMNGIQSLSNSIRSAPASQQPSLYMCFCSILRHPVKEMTAGVFTTAVEELIQLTDSVRVSGEIIRGAIDPLRAPILLRLGNKNQRMTMAAHDFALWAASNQQLGISFIAPMIMAALKPPIQWSSVNERIGIIQEILNRFGLGEPPFDEQNILNFVLANIESPRANVRTAAQKVICTLADVTEDPSSVLKAVQSSNISMQTKKSIEDGLRSEKARF